MLIHGQPCIPHFLAGNIQVFHAPVSIKGCRTQLVHVRKHEGHRLVLRGDIVPMGQRLINLFGLTVFAFFEINACLSLFRPTDCDVIVTPRDEAIGYFKGFIGMIAAINEGEIVIGINVEQVKKKRLVSRVIIERIFYDLHISLLVVVKKFARISCSFLRTVSEN